MKNTINGTKITVTVFHRGTWRKVTRVARAYQVQGRRETCIVSVHGKELAAERYPSTVWTAEAR